MYHSLNILHVDMDAFFASVEQSIHPQYQNKPIAVCNTSSTRGVISASSYEAKQYGVQSGMPIQLAKKKYPQLILVQAHYNVYQKISNQIMQILNTFTPDYEKYSIDEAFLDVSRTKHLFKHQIDIAKKIQKKIEIQFHLTASVGISENKLLAKFATELHKPKGITVLTRQTFLNLTENMLISTLPGIGKKTTEFFKRDGITTFHDLRKLSLSYLQSNFGKNGLFLFNAVRGQDSSKIQTKSEPKSIGNEITLEADTQNLTLIKSLLFSLVSKTTRRMRQSHKKTKTIHLKIRYFDFQTFSIQKSLPHWTNNESIIFTTIIQLLNQVEIRPIRLVGVSLSNFQKDTDSNEQLSLFK